MQKIIKALPKRFKWTIHNVIAHPISEVLFQLGFPKTSEAIHDLTVPEEGC
jgi:hypothetical protein